MVYCRLMSEKLGRIIYKESTPVLQVVDFLGSGGIMSPVSTNPYARNPIKLEKKTGIERESTIHYPEIREI